MKPEPTRETTVDRMVFLARQLGNDVVDPVRERRFVETLGERLIDERTAVKRRRITLSVTLAAAVLLAPVFGHFALRDPELSYRLSGAQAAEGYIVGQEHAEVLFSDGSKVELASGARTQVDEVTAHGATVRLAEGAIALDIVKAKGNSWAVQAGPYRVHVVGTAFDVRWSEGAQELEVDLHRGSVFVTGPGIQGELTLQPGERLISGTSGPHVSPSGSQPAKHFALTPAPSLPDTTKSTSEEAVAPAVDSSLAAEGAEVKVPRREMGTSPSWSSWVAQGQYQRVIAAAEQRGVTEVLNRGSQAELAAFADASRYARQPKLARRALLAERSRFPKAAASRGSAFFLGGIEADGSAAALRWFETYLSEAPNGAYAPQALGRRMMILHRQRGKAASSALARDYLKRFPQGPYAAAAQQILGQFSE
jgi:FecR protein